MSQTNPESPAEIVQHVCVLPEKKSWYEVGNWIDRRALAQWREAQLDNLSPRKPHTLTVEDYRKHRPEMPAQVVEWHVQEHNRAAQQFDPSEFGKGADPAQLAGLTHGELFGRWLEVQAEREKQGFLVVNAPPLVVEMATEVNRLRRQVIGELIVEDLAWVPYLARHGPSERGEANLAVLRRTDGQWRMLVGGELFNSGNWAFAVGLDETEAQAHPLPVSQIRWFNRRFDHELTPEHFPALLERFRCTPLRLLELFALPRSLRTKRLDGQWSIQEHVGHLLDLEELGERRLADYRSRAPELSAADLSNRKTEEAHHNDSDWWELLERFREARTRLVTGLASLPADNIAHRALHPRLQRMMNVPEWIFFMCEHDDHHLARISELTLRLWTDAS